VSLIRGFAASVSSSLGPPPLTQRPQVGAATGMPLGQKRARSIVTSNKKRKAMQTNAAENVRYVELAPRPTRSLIEETAQAIDQLQDIKSLRKEHFVALYLNARHELIHKELISIGTVNASMVHPRDVFTPALVHNAVAIVIVIAHNNPSGDATPSGEDRDVTHRLKEAGRPLGISVLEHIIITEFRRSEAPRGITRLLVTSDRNPDPSQPRGRGRRVPPSPTSALKGVATFKCVRRRAGSIWRIDHLHFSCLHRIQMMPKMCLNTCRSQKYKGGY
jgi:hypothetical protein